MIMYFHIHPILDFAHLKRYCLFLFNLQIAAPYKGNSLATNNSKSIVPDRNQLLCLLYSPIPTETLINPGVTQAIFSLLPKVVGAY